MVTETARDIADMANDEAPVLRSVGLRPRALPGQPDDVPGQGERWHGEDDEAGLTTATEPVTRKADVGARELAGEDLPVDPAANTHTSTEDITVDGEELLEARWFTRPELARYAADNPLGRPDSIDRHLLRTWLAGGDALEPDATGSTKT
jgi:hypothetical protein